MSNPVLPSDPQAAIEKLMEITIQMIRIMEDEARAIALKNEVGMLDAEGRKNEMLPLYQQAAREFSQRVEDFRGIDKSRLDELQGLQDALGAVTKENQFYLAS